MMHRVCCLLLAGLALSSSQGAEPDKKPNSRRAEKLRSLVRFLEVEVETAKRLRERQAESVAEVDRLTAALAKTRHDLAVTKGDQGAAITHCQQLIDVRNRQLNRQVELYQGGFGSHAELVGAMRRLAVARYQHATLEGDASEATEMLGKVERFCENELNALLALKSGGAASPMEVSRARYRATIAAYCLAKQQDNTSSIGPKLNLAVSRCEQDLSQIENLHQQGFAGLHDVYFAQTHCLEAKLLRASLEKDRVALLSTLEELVLNHQKVLPTLGDDRKGKVLRVFIEHALERDQNRSRQLQRDGDLEDDFSVSELDF
ncbi:MAG: hypothetical protein AAFX06_03700 [Planctomycetota bacterium]